LSNFKSDLIFWFDWSRDGKQLALSRGTVNSDVVLIREEVKVEKQPDYHFPTLYARGFNFSNVYQA